MPSFRLPLGKYNYIRNGKNMRNQTEQRPQETPRTTSLPEPNDGNSRGTGPRTPGHQR